MSIISLRPRNLPDASMIVPSLDFAHGWRAGALTAPLPAVSQLTRCADVHAALVNRPDYLAMAVVDSGNRPVGLVNRVNLMTRYSQQYVPELFNRRPITMLMDRKALIVDAETGIDDLGTQVALEHPQALFDGIIVTQGGQYMGICTGLALMRGKVELSHARGIELQRAREEADRANRAKSDFLAQMSHELRTPLNAILGFSEIMQHEMFGPVGNARYRDYANDIHVSGAHLLSIINDILDLAKAEAGKQELQEDRMSVVETVTACVRLMGERATNAGVGLENNVPPDLPDLHADERKVKQVLLNLLSNAVKFTPPGGRIAVDARIDDDGTMQVEVSDTGIGMSVADIPKALAPFGQIDSRLARKYQGTGLGLPLVRALTDLHGATLNIVSAVGQGTTVVVTFPACRVLAAEGEEISRRVAG